MFNGNAMRYVRPEMVEATIKVLGSWTPFMVCCIFDRTTVILKDFTLNRRFCFVHWKTLFFQFFEKCHVGSNSPTCKPCSRASVRSPIKGITSLKLVDSTMYSTSMVDMAVIICIFDAQVTGAPANWMIHPNLDLDVIGSIWASAWHQFPAKSASTQQSKCHSLLGCIIRPLSRVASK